MNEKPELQPALTLESAIAELKNFLVTRQTDENEDARRSGWYSIMLTKDNDRLVQAAAGLKFANTPGIEIDMINEGEITIIKWNPTFLPWE
jgi:hypothetical protein